MGWNLTRRVLGLAILIAAVALACKTMKVWWDGTCGPLLGDARVESYWIVPPRGASISEPTIFVVSRTGSLAHRYDFYYRLGGSAVYGVLPPGAPRPDDAPFDEYGAEPARGHPGLYRLTLPAGEATGRIVFERVAHYGKRGTRAFTMQLFPAGDPEADVARNQPITRFRIGRLTGSGFAVAADPPGSGERWVFAVPCWAAVLLLGVAATLLFRPSRASLVRWTARFGIGLSFTAAIVLACLWVDSYRCTRMIGMHGTRNQVEASSSRGCLLLDRATRVDPIDALLLGPYGTIWQTRRPPADMKSEWRAALPRGTGPQLAGVFTLSGTNGDTHYSGVFVPYAVLTPVALIAPLAALGRWHRGQRRRRNGRCLHCGYDLRADVTGICPECGRPKIGGNPPAGVPKSGNGDPSTETGRSVHGER
jgi:hypothetical protein